MEVELFDKPALFSNDRIKEESVPNGLYLYDLGGSDYNPDQPSTVEPIVFVNYAGSVLTIEPLEFPEDDHYIPLNEGLKFTGNCLELKDFCNKHGVATLEMEYGLRPATQDETGLFYAMSPEKDHETGCIGHVRIDFGHGGKEFWHTWHPRGPEELNSPDFKAELQEVVDEMRKTVLASLVTMNRFCINEGGHLDNSRTPNYGYIAESKRYRYCLRCNPTEGDYNAYLTCFDKQVQEMNQVNQLEQNMQLGGM